MTRNPQTSGEEGSIKILRSAVIEDRRKFNCSGCSPNRILNS
jgi:hypothetical protein